MSDEAARLKVAITALEIRAECCDELANNAARQAGASYDTAHWHWKREESLNRAAAEAYRTAVSEIRVALAEER